MELRQLRAVEAVARHRHFTRAADELRVAQSALSHQIRRLEQELGTPLFERTSRRVSPTEAGRAIAARARRILSEVDGAHQEVDELRGVLRGRIWIGALLPAGDLDVPGLLARFSRAHPASRSACARASPPTCFASSPPTSSTPPSAWWPASSPTISPSSD